MFDFFKNDREDLTNAIIKLSDALSLLGEELTEGKSLFVTSKLVSNALMAALNFVTIAGVFFGAQETLKKLDQSIVNVGAKS